MALDLASQLMAATVEIEQQLPDGRHMIGAGFLIDDPTPDGRARTVLVTAAHVLNNMPGRQAHIGYRVQGASGSWRYAPQSLTIRSAGGPLWRRSPDHDVAVMAVVAPPQFAKAAIPLAWLADTPAFTHSGLNAGDELLVLGYPQGLSANTAGFPILRSGRVASPIDEPDQSPTFLLDFRVFPGNSGGPVFALNAPAADLSQPAPVVMGMLTQQVEMNNERLEIGIVTEAPFIRDTIEMLDKPSAAAPNAVVAAGPAPAADDASKDAAAWVGERVSD
jgi:S1-C subfamily serine protease